MSDARMPDAADALRRFADAPDQASDSAAALVHSHGPHLDPIAVHQTCGIGPRQQQRPRGIVRDHEHVAVGAAPDESREPFGFACGGEPLGAHDRLPIAYHRGEPLFQGVALRLGTHSEPLRQALRTQRFGRLRQVLEQQFTARDRVLVALSLELEVRILGTPIARLVGNRLGLLRRARIVAATACHGLEIPRNSEEREVNSFAPPAPAGLAISSPTSNTPGRSPPNRRARTDRCRRGRARRAR